MEKLVIGFIIAIVIIAVLFFVLREFFCWYWKINDLKKQTENVNEQLNEIKNLLIIENNLLSTG